MFRRKLLVLIAAIVAISFVADSVCHAALASKLGKKRYTARLSSNKAVRKQQLIVDPEGIIGGSASVQYDTSVVRLVDVLDIGDFQITGGFVGVTPDTGGLSNNLIPLDEFLAGRTAALVPGVQEEPPLFTELGYVQIFFDRRDAVRGDAGAASLQATTGNSVIPNLPGYLTVDEDGETGINDTHALLFEYLPGVRDETAAAYRVFATAPRPQTVPDSIISEDDPENPIPYTELGTAGVVGSLIGFESRPEPVPVPLPPAALAGALGLAMVAGYRRRSRLQ